MNIQGFQKMTLLDFPGRVACTVFTGGCNLRCPFCHNGGLVRTPMEHGNMTDAVLDYLSRRRGILDGVCLTGGEPLLQPDLEDFLFRLHEMGFLVKLDTNGALPKRLSRVLDAGLVDYVAMDVKSSPEGYGRATGSDISPDVFAESMDLIRRSGIPYEFRTTAVKGIHEVNDFCEIGKWLRAEDPYFIQTFVDSGNLLGSGCSAFDEEEMQTILLAVKPYLPRAELRGQS